MPEAPRDEHGGFGLPGLAGALFDLMEEERERQRTPCKEGRLLARYAHWECRAGRWCNVVYGEYQCPDGSIQRIEQEVQRTSDPCVAPDVNHLAAPELQALLGESPAAVAALLEARPFATPDDLFRRPGLLKAVGEAGLVRVAVWMWRQDRHRAVHERREELSASHPVGVVYGVARDHDGDQRLFIRTQAGAELMSARFATGADIPLDEWSYRVGGFRPWELPQLEGEELEELRLLLYSRPAHAAAVLWQSAAPLLGTQEQQTAFRALSSILGSILFKSRAPRSPFGLYGYSNNGCTVVPDWNRAFQECCEAHDACYGRGGNEADRAACDAELFRCLKSKGFTGRAWLYFLGVRVQPDQRRSRRRDPRCQFRLQRQHLCRGPRCRGRRHGVAAVRKARHPAFLVHDHHELRRGLAKVLPSVAAVPSGRASLGSLASGFRYCIRLAGWGSGRHALAEQLRGGSPAD